MAISEADDDLAVLANFDLGWALWANGDHRAAVAQIEVTQAVVSDLGLGLVYDTMVKVQELEMRHCAGELGRITTGPGVRQMLARCGLSVELARCS